MPTAVALSFDREQGKPSIDDPALEEQIRERAQEIWQQRAGESGSDVSDWLKAEEEILVREEYYKAWKDQGQRSAIDQA